MSVAVEAGAKAWFDRIQSQRMDSGGRRPDGQRWQWEDIAESDRVAYRALALPVVEAALSAASGQRGRDNQTANCEHWGHAEGEWKWSYCACSGLPNGCDKCT